MFIFIRLLLAHLIGDFPLQFNKVFALKHKGLLGGLAHSLIITGCFILFSWPYLKLPFMWAFIVFLGATHLLQDSIKISYKEIKHSFWLYILDQLSHVGLISLLFYTDIKNLAPPQTTNLFVSLYNNDKLLLYLIAMLLATYNAYFMIRNLKNTFMGKICMCPHTEKWFGMVERGALVTLFFIDKIPYIVVLLLMRPIFSFIWGGKLGLHKKFIWSSEIVLSWSVGLLTAIPFYILLNN